LSKYKIVRELVLGEKRENIQIHQNNAPRLGTEEEEKTIKEENDFGGFDSKEEKKEKIE
jgi:hypothetical protein